MADQLGRHEDERGVIQDILGPVDAVTTIFTKAGATRGNHVHYETTQWTYIVSGTLMVVTRSPAGKTETAVYSAGQMACEQPGTVHAWRALTDCLALVFTKGPRSGENYESDTFRLSGDDRLLIP